MNYVLVFEPNDSFLFTCVSVSKEHCNSRLVRLSVLLPLVPGAELSPIISLVWGLG